MVILSRRKMEKKAINISTESIYQFIYTSAICISPYELGKNIGFSRNSLVRFLKIDSSKQNINCHIIIALADYFNVSIDEMIQRIHKSLSLFTGRHGDQ